MKKLSSLLFCVIFVLTAFANSRLVILHTNDLHGSIGPSTAFWINPEFPPLLGGGASISTLIDEVKREAEKNGYDVIVADIGDIWQGTPVGEKTEGRAILDFFELAGYDFWVIGNHEFDMGTAKLKEMVEYSKIPVITANLTDTETGAFPDWNNLSPYIIKKFQNYTVGIIGLVTEDMPSLLPEENLKGIKFESIGSTVLKYRELLKSEGCDLIILASHCGITYSIDEKYSELIGFEKEALEAGLQYGTIEYIDFVRSKKRFGLQDHEIAALIPGIDVIVGAHSHAGLYPPYEDPRNHTLVVQAYSKGSALGRLDLMINNKARAIYGYENTNYTPYVDTTPPKKKVRKKIDKYIEETEKELEEVVGISKKPLTRGNDETFLGNIITDAIRTEFNADFALFNRGGMRTDLPAGEITGRDVYQTLPFSNTVVLIEIKGVDIIEMLQIGYSGRRRDTQISGLKVLYNPGLSTKNKLCDVVLLDGTRIDPDKVYKLATSDYLAEGAIGYSLFRDLNKLNTFTLVRDAVSSFIKKNSPIDMRLEGRIKRDSKAKMNEEFLQQLKELGLEK